MINRRLIRIKVFKLLFSKIHADSRSLAGAGNELLQSLEKTVDLYYLMLTLSVALKNYGLARIEAGLQKFHPTPQEANPNRKFVQNRVIAALENDKVRKQYAAKKGLLWSDSPAFLKKLYTDLQMRPWFMAYMEADTSSFEEDLTLLRTFYEAELEDLDELYEMLEDQSIYWTDELAYVLGVILKVLSTAKEGVPFDHPEAFKQKEDKDYAMHLLEHALLHYDEYFELLRKFTLNWDPDRMAATDICLIILGITEVLHFPTIPVKVTINEVVELAKHYSTPNSKLFVNGVLDKIVQHLKEEGRIVKEGRGLIDS